MAYRSWSDGDREQVAGWVRSEMKDVFSGASILLVEDEDDIRQLMSTLLRLAGFEPTECSSAEVALEQLREQPFDLVLTDYALPNRSGGWLLQQARAEALLDATPVLVVSAHPNPPDVEGYEVICKPFDLDDLVTRVKLRLDSGPRPPRPTSSSASKRSGDHGDSDCPDPVELILYVNVDSPESAGAIDNIKRVLARFASARVKLTICDLSQNPDAGAADVAFRATLMKRSSGPRTFILGHITSPDVLVEILQDCGAGSF